MARKTNAKWKTRYFLAFIPLAFFVAFPFMVDAEASYLVYFFFTTFMYVALAQGWNLVAGYTGQVSLGQSAFFGLGAYVTAISWKAGWTGYLDPSAMLLSGVGASLLAAIVGMPLLAKLRGDYFALGTLGLAEILRVVCVNGGKITGGPVGIMLSSSAYESMKPYYYIALVIALLSIASLWLLTRSTIGLALVAIREDEMAAGANGVAVLKYKIFAFAAGAFFTGMCGSLNAYYTFHVHPAGVYGLNWVIIPILMALLGGAGTIWGPVIGAFLLAAAFELANEWLPEIHPIFSGAFIILVTLFLPNGVMSAITGRKPDFVRRLPLFNWAPRKAFKPGKNERTG